MWRALLEPAAPVLQVLLLVLPGARGQHSTPGPPCDCAYNVQKRSGLFCCKGCPAGEPLKGWEGLGESEGKQREMGVRQG